MPYGSAERARPGKATASARARAAIRRMASTPNFVREKHVRGKSPAAFNLARSMRVMQMPALVPVLRICVMAAAVAIASGGSFAQSLAGRDLVDALRQGGYVLVMRHANSPQTRP